MAQVRIFRGVLRHRKKDKFLIFRILILYSGAGFQHFFAPAPLCATGETFRSTAGCFFPAVVSKQLLFRGENILFRPQMNLRMLDNGKTMASRPRSYSQKDQSAENNIHGSLAYTKERLWCTRSNLKCRPYTYSLARCTGITPPAKCHHHQPKISWL